MAQVPSKVRKRRTSSKGRKSRVGSKTVERLDPCPMPWGKKGSVRHSLKVFAKPELQVPFRLGMFLAGKGQRSAAKAPLWLQVAVLSGLAEMVSPEKAKVGEGLLSPVNKRHPPKRMKPGELDALMLKGMAEALPYLQPSKEEPEKK